MIERDDDEMLKDHQSFYNLSCGNGEYLYKLSFQSSQQTIHWRIKSFEMLVALEEKSLGVHPPEDTEVC